MSGKLFWQIVLLIVIFAFITSIATISSKYAFYAMCSGKCPTMMPQQVEK